MNDSPYTHTPPYEIVASLSSGLSKPHLLLPSTSRHDSLQLPFTVSTVQSQAVLVELPELAPVELPGTIGAASGSSRIKRFSHNSTSWASHSVPMNLCHSSRTNCVPPSIYRANAIAQINIKQNTGTPINQSVVVVPENVSSGSMPVFFMVYSIHSSSAAAPVKRRHFC